MTNNEVFVLQMFSLADPNMSVLEGLYTKIQLLTELLCSSELHQTDTAVRSLRGSGAQKPLEALVTVQKPLPLPTDI